MEARRSATSELAMSLSMRRYRSSHDAPAVGGVSPVIIRIVVDLPAPLGPRKPVTVPGAHSNDTSLTAVCAP